MRTMIFVIVALSLNAAFGDDDAVKKEMAQLEGEWTMVSGSADGQSLPDDLVKDAKRVAKNGETTVTIGGELYFKAKFTIDPTKKPKSIDYVMNEGPTKGKTQLGIYKLDGDTVEFCFAGPGDDRPTEFSSKPGSKKTSSVWKREKK